LKGNVVSRTGNRRLHAQRWWLWVCTAGAALAIAGVVILRPGVASQVQQETLPLTGRWVPTNLRLAVHTLLADPHRRGLLLAGTTSGVWHSTNGGATWRPDGRGPQEDIFALSAGGDGRTVLAGAFDGVVYARDSTGSVRWRPISPPLQTLSTDKVVQRGAGITAGSSSSAAEVAPIFSVAVSPNGRTALAGSLGTLYRGATVGVHWSWQQVLANGHAAITSILWPPWNAHLVFATTFEQAPPVVVSHDGGQTWHADAAGLPVSLPTQALCTGTTATHQLLLTTMGGGVWMRSSTGVWRDTSTGLPQRHAMPLITSTRYARALYAGTMGYGVYEKWDGAAWHHLGRGLSGASGIVLSLAETDGPSPVLLAGTANGLFRYELPG
jgi:hypothetical protein